MTFYKIIGNNKGNYPYRIGLNTLKHTNEEFNPSSKCETGGLYYTTIEYILGFMFFGDQLCVIEIPEDAKIVEMSNKFK